MTEIAFACEWLSSGQDAPELRDTTAQFTLRVGDVVLTRNEDVWSKTVRDSVLVSAYPLALWLAASWWRLIHEPSPERGIPPTIDWRMAHEMGAAGHGYVWPHVVFESDGEAMQISATASKPGSAQSVHYLNGLPMGHLIVLADFQRVVDEFIQDVLNRLRAIDCPNTDLSSLWQFVLEDRASLEAARTRRIEAQLGYDPEECPETVLAEALILEDRLGASAWSELAPVYARHKADPALDEIPKLADGDGLLGKPDALLPVPAKGSAVEPPWKRAVEAARTLRRHLGNERSPIGDETLYGLLGLSAQKVGKWTPLPRQPIGIAVPRQHSRLKFVPRKTHPISKRFEFSRFLGDHLRQAQVTDTDRWLASTDLLTARQKYQRAFAAEFLCPIHALIDFLQGDVSKAARDYAALHFDVSTQTVKSLLVNNGYLTRDVLGEELPY